MLRALPSTTTKLCLIAKHSLATHSRCLATNTNTITSLVDNMEPKQVVQRYQNVLVMRHGDRLDNSDPSWLNTAPRQWDPPLTTMGRARAHIAGADLRTQLGFPIHRIAVSPFLRCLETANELIHGLCGVENGIVTTGNHVTYTDSSEVKVSIEYGLCEMFNKVAIRHPPARPENNGEWGFNRSELEKLLPQQTIDHTAHRVYDKLPQWQEEKEDAAARFKRVINELADNYPSENLLLITHGEGVCVAVTTYSDVKMKKTQYCSYAKLKRPIFENSETFPEEFEFENLVDGPEISLNIKKIDCKI